MTIHPILLAAIVGMAVSTAAKAAEPASFGLSGPALHLAVGRGGTTLPIASVLQLAEGDTLSIRAGLPPDQSMHYLLVAAFLRGATNPPPKDQIDDGG